MKKGQKEHNYKRCKTTTGDMSVKHTRGITSAVDASSTEVLVSGRPQFMIVLRFFFVRILPCFFSITLSFSTYNTRIRGVRHC